nr:DUF1508 domain-containing protein [uncultured Devosia sp.]
MSHKFNITFAANDQFKFDFSYNSEKIFWSENYKQKASIKNAIDSLKTNAPGAATVDVSKGEGGSGYRFEIKKSSDDQFYVNFVASNGEIMVRTERYTAKASAQNAIESLKSNGPDADVNDETVSLGEIEARLRTNPEGVSSQLRSVSIAAQEKLDSVQSEIPNSLEGKSRKERASEFLRELSHRSNEVADKIDSKPDSITEAARLLQKLSDFVSRWISENSELIRKFRLVGLIGLSCAILNFLGCTPIVSSVASTFLFGGKELAEYVASALGNDKKPK